MPLIRRYVSPPVKKRVIYVQGKRVQAQWKVAYADFVTALMAFFLLMWLVTATSPIQKMQIADYFTPTFGVSQSLGVGTEGGKKPMEPGSSADDLTPVGLVAGQVHKGDAPDVQGSELGTNRDKAQYATTVRAEDLIHTEEEYRNGVEGVKQSLESDPMFSYLKQDILIQDTPEGLKIVLLDDGANRLFNATGTHLTDAGAKMIAFMADILGSSNNLIAIYGHTPSRPKNSDAQRYSDWELSLDRAAAVRRELEARHVAPQRFIQIVGVADKEPLLPRSPASSRNRRITIVLVHSLGVQAVSSVPAH